MTVDNMSGYFFINAILKNRFAIDKWGLLYWKVGRNKVVNKCRLGEI